MQSLALFGSVLRAGFHPDSDVDILVAFEPGARIGFMAMSRRQRELTELLHRPVDLIPKDGLKSSICDAVLANSEVFHLPRSQPG